MEDKGEEWDLVAMEEVDLAVEAVKDLAAMVVGDIVEADQDDLDFLKNFLNNPALKSILQTKDTLEDDNPPKTLHLVDNLSRK